MQSCFGGDGGDELFGGYSYYRMLLNFQKLSNFIPLSLRRNLKSVSEEKLNLGFKGRNFIRFIGHDLKREIPIIPTFLDQTNLKKILKDDYFNKNNLSYKYNEFNDNEYNKCNDKEGF